MIRLVALFGTGDVYLVSALFDAFKHHHGRPDTELIIKDHDKPVVDLFGLPYVVDNDLVTRAEQDHEFQCTYDNVLLGDQPFYVHPSFICSGAHVEKLTARWTASQADMYRCLLDLRTDAPLASPINLPAIQPKMGTVLLIPDARSWPNSYPDFWNKLGDRLVELDRQVTYNNINWSLSELFLRCSASEWVIGPQCGVMSILVAAGFPCRKTICTPSIDGNDHPGHLGWAIDTYPYAYVTKFSGQDYDVEEYKITDNNHIEVIDSVVLGINALRLKNHVCSPVMMIDAPLSPGDFLDRLAVLTVKRNKFTLERRALIEREYQRYCEIKRQARFSDKVDAAFEILVRIHEIAFDTLEELVPQDLPEDYRLHRRAIQTNRNRVEVKQMIDALCNAAYTEVKSYHR